MGSQVAMVGLATAVASCSVEKGIEAGLLESLRVEEARKT